MDSKLPKYVELKTLRVLTLIANKPETGPQDTVTVTPVISDVTETSSLTYEAYGCVDPGVSIGADPSCSGNPTRVLIAQDSITTSSNLEMSQNFTGNAPSLTVTIPASAIIFNQRSTQDQFNGVSYLVEYKLTNSKGEQVIAIKRIVVSTKSNTDRNTNPTATEINANSTSLTSFPTSGVFNLKITLASGSNQSYPVLKDDGSQEIRSEDVTTTWFITDGSLKYFRTTNDDTNEYTAPDSLPTDRKAFLISISRDSRGGVSVRRLCGGC